LLLHVTEQAHLVTESVHWYTECPCQSEISNFQLPSLVDQQVLGFKVSVKNPVVVTECDSLLHGDMGARSALVEFRPTETALEPAYLEKLVHK